MKIRYLPLMLAALVSLAAANPAGASEFAFGADLSFLKQAEDNGVVFKDGTNTLPGLQIFRDHGYNWIRLRLFVEPVGQRLPNNFAYTLAMATEAKKLGYKFLLDLHYASTWADPAKQPTPEQWKNLTHRQRTKAVYKYTRDTLKKFDDAGVPPDMVQIGNEIRNGMLWPDGRVPQHWDNFADYLRAGIKGVHAAGGKGPGPKIMIHFDQGASIPRTKYFFDNLKHYGVHYDVIGFSYYPWWHGDIEDLRENLAFAAKRYDKDVYVAEVAYYWRPSQYFRKSPPPFPESPEGQRDFLDEVTRTVMNVPDGRGKGVFWWEPAVSNRGLGGRGFFDDDGEALPVITVFDKYTRPERPTAND